MRCLSLIALLTASMLSGCFIVTDDPDDDDSGNAGETGSVEEVLICADPGTNSMENPNGECVCQEGLIWCTDDPDDVTCCAGACGDPGTNSQVAAGDECECVAGFDWCTDNAMDVSCCAA